MPKPPVVSGPWKAVADESPTWSPHFITPRSEFVQSYQAGNNVVKLYVAFYGTLQPGVNMTSRANTLFAAPWSRTDERERTIVFERHVTSVERNNAAFRPIFASRVGLVRD